MSGPTKILEMLGAPAAAPAPRPRRCWRCENLAAHAETAGVPAPTVNEAESWVQLSNVYYAGLCRECADWEWSARWNARREAAAGSLPDQQALDRERAKHVERGRRFSPDARLTRPSR